jgi:RND family efflux transporter MFP subunit
MKRSRRAGLLALILLVGGAGCRKTEEAAPEGAALDLVTVEKGDVREWLRLAGRVAPPPDRETKLAPLVAGRLTDVRVRGGQAVRAGDVVARLEPGPLDDELMAAQAAERRAASEADLKKRVAVRTQGLFEKGVASRQEAEGDQATAVAAESALAESRSALSAAQRRRSWAELRAPFDGIVLSVLRQAGDSVDGSPGTPVIELAAPHPLEIAASATADALARISPGQEARVRVAGAEEVSAQVARAARSVDPATGVGEVRLRLRESPPAALLGASADAEIALAERKGVLVVPSSALRRNPAGATEVLLVEDGKTALRAVEIGVVDAGRAEVRSGLKEGDRVVGEPIGLEGGLAVKEHP